MAAVDSAPAPRESKPRQGRRRQILTPEGVNLPVDLADRGERLGALIIDLVIIVGALLAVYLMAILVLPFSNEFAVALVVLISFSLRSFYFIFFELRSQGRTPGKKLLGLRVIDRKGGPLLPDAVFARNLMREIELFLPISILLAVQFDDGGGWALAFVLVLVSIFALMPFFNKDRLRVGDIVGGTWVVTAPKSILLRDISESTIYWRETRSAEGSFVFTSQQLDAYGIYELQTLEHVIRASGANARQTQAEVCERIRNKIGWTGEVDAVQARVFLESFYAALRARLEANLLLGKRREDKYDSPKRRP